MLILHLLQELLLLLVNHLSAFTMVQTPSSSAPPSACAMLSSSSLKTFRIFQLQDWNPLCPRRILPQTLGTPTQSCCLWLISMSLLCPCSQPEPFSSSSSLCLASASSHPYPAQGFALSSSTFYSVSAILVFSMSLCTNLKKAQAGSSPLSPGWKC